VGRLRTALCALGLLLAATARALGPGDVAPDFSLTDTNGKPLRLSDLRGKLVLVNFWASWCGPCLEEMPRLSAWQHDYGAAGLRVVGISMDDDVAPVRRLLGKHPVDYPVGVGDVKLAERYGKILDRSGRIVALYKGEVDLAVVESEIKSRLKAPL
jgi:thiol-disulfide isomerase/thioredoxin